ncbi:hypothetical protein ACSBR2_034345 [Camellia fascicularis]
MDKLINSKEDMNQLRRPEVLDNLLDDDNELALMFNNLSKGKIISKHGGRRVDSLNHDNSTNVWVTVATIAAAFLLLLTISDSHFPNYYYYSISIPLLI